VNKYPILAVSLFLLTYIFLASCRNNDAKTTAPTWPITVNPPSSTHARTYALASDASSLYIAGNDNGPGASNYEWRTEKRRLSDGQLITDFGINGVALSPLGGANAPSAIASDSTSLYIAGYDTRYGNAEWRIEKRSLSTGKPVTSPLFGTSGVVADNPGGFNDIPYAAALDSTALYVAGMEGVSSADTQWRIVKRSLTDGSLIAAFGTNGVVTSTTGSNTNEARALVIDLAESALYIVGFESATAADTQWRIEKRNLLDGQLVTAFGTNGVITGGPGKAFAAALDSTALYVAGYDSGIGAVDTQWKIAKYDLTSGAAVAAFGTNGVVAGNPGAAGDAINAIVIDGAGLYAAGYDSVPGNGDTAWRLEKRNATTGALIPAFAANGVYRSSSGEASALTSGAAALYMAGYDTEPGNNGTEWRIEKIAK